MARRQGQPKTAHAALPPTGPRPCPRPWLAAGLLVLVTVACYSNSLRGPFILDDVTAIPENPTIRHLWPLAPVLFPPAGGGRTVEGRPILNLSLALNFAWGRLDVRGYHAFNLAVHVLAVLLLFGIVRRTTGFRAQGSGFRARHTTLEQAGGRPPPTTDNKRRTTNLEPRASSHEPRTTSHEPRASSHELRSIAFAAALLWAVHPLQTQAVTYTIQRAESLMGLFLLLTLYASLRAAGSRRRRLWCALAVTACALGMATKESMSAAPILVVLYDRAFLAHSFREALRRRWGLYLGLAATWILLGVLVATSGGRSGTTGFGQHISPLAYALTQPAALLRYLNLSFWPSALCLDYGWPVAATAREVLPGAFVVGSLLALTVWALVRRPEWGFLGAWFFLVLAPSSSFVPIVTQTMAEHRMYLPLAGVVVAVVLLAQRGWERLAQARVGGPSLTLPSPTGRGATTARRARAIVPPLIVLILAGLLAGRTYARNHDYRSALSIWEDTVRKAPGNVRALANLGAVLSDGGRPREALEVLDRAVAIMPSCMRAYYNRAGAHYRAGEYDPAIRDFDKVIELEPGFAQAYATRGWVHYEAKHAEEAVRDFREATALRPEIADLHNKLGAAYVLAGRFEEAAAEFGRTIELEPAAVRPYLNRAGVLLQLGRFDQALEDCSRALRLDPAYADSYLVRAGCRCARGEYEQAWEDVRTARSLGGTPNPDLLRALTKATGLEPEGH